MTGTRWMWPLIAALVAVAPADAGINALFGKKPKTDAQVKRLAETTRTDGDEKKRRAAVAELRDCDPRVHPDVIPALVAALQRDPSAQVRVDAAEAIGQFKAVFPVAGLALEVAAESDPTPAVRDSAHQALWEYHLAGYRSARGADGFAGQTAEPPIARVTVTRPAGGVPPRVTTPPIRPVSVGPPPALPGGGLPTIAPVLPPGAAVSAPRSLPGLAALVKRLSLPAPGSRVGPVMARAFAWKPAPAAPPGPPVLLSATPPPVLNVTAEPPVARPRVLPHAPAPRLVGDVVVFIAPVFPAFNATSESEVILLPAVSAPPGPVVADPPVRLPAPAPVNDYGPRVSPPAARVLTGLERFTPPE